MATTGWKSRSSRVHAEASSGSINGVGGQGHIATVGLSRCVEASRKSLACATAILSEWPATGIASKFITVVYDDI
jgi:hypothetical protein